MEESKGEITHGLKKVPINSFHSWETNMTKLHFRVFPKLKENTTNVQPMTALSVDFIPGGQITKIKLREDDGSHLLLLCSESNPATVSGPV